MGSSNKVRIDELNTADGIPKKGDILIIKTKKSKNKKILCKVKDIVNGNELILNKATNSFFNWDMYRAGESWVWRVWNLGDIEITSSTNSMKSISDF